ncbi:hypothetical protein JCM30237_22850 [Halolamina litorea]|uniref:DUF4112 domain-containing protein n=1 Tax=Halolamina litorea TaxID=1515593 RepID=A0ABD6BR73_9EURY|nr:DUF4112 domain-containing protein [Halolamina litorea]
MTDPARLDRARRVADLLDGAFSLPVVGEIGLDGLLGLLPIVGDWVTAVPALYIVYQGYRLGLPRLTLAVMLLRVGVDAVAGSVPVFGDLLDITWKANRRNVARIERHLDGA